MNISAGISWTTLENILVGIDGGITVDIYVALLVETPEQIQEKSEKILAGIYVVIPLRFLGRAFGE